MIDGNVGGDAIGSTAANAGHITTGKDNVQVVTTMDSGRQQHGETNELWRAVQRIETTVMSLGNKLDMALSEQGRLSQNDQAVTQQLSMVVQQQVHNTAQMTALTAAVAQHEQRLSRSESNGLSRTDWLLLALVIGGVALVAIFVLLWVYR